MKSTLNKIRNSQIYDRTVTKIKKYPYLYKITQKIAHLFFREPRIPSYKIKEILTKLETIDSDKLVILPPVHGNDWMGIHVSTKQFFDEKDFFKLEHEFNSSINEELSIAINEKFIHVTFSGISSSYLKLISALRSKNSAIIINVMYHGSFTQLANDYDNMVFRQLLEQLASTEINSVGCFKRDVALYIQEMGYNGKILQNKVTSIDNVTPKKLNMTQPIHIGLMSNHGWIKNIYNQYMAATLIPNSVIHVQMKHDLLINMGVKVVSHGHMDHESFLFFLDLLDIYLHVSFSEASPITPLEAYARGIPCLVQSSTGFFDDNTYLAKFLYVDALDDSYKIKEKIEMVLENYYSISKACIEFVRIRNIEADNLFLDFLNG